MSDDSIRTAELFLREIVYRSRARQAAGAALAGGDLNAPSGDGRCGLGEKAALVLELEGRSRELADELWPDDLSGGELERVQACLKAWVQRQDGLDRTRNHFLRGFRETHGFDRSSYGEDEQRAYRKGLDEVNENENRLRREAARELLGLS